MRAARFSSIDLLCASISSLSFSSPSPISLVISLSACVCVFVRVHNASSFVLVDVGCGVVAGVGDEGVGVDEVGPLLQ